MRDPVISPPVDAEASVRKGSDELRRVLAPGGVVPARPRDAGCPSCCGLAHDTPPPPPAQCVSTSLGTAWMGLVTIDRRSQVCGLADCVLKDVRRKVPGRPRMAATKYVVLAVLAAIADQPADCQVRVAICQQLILYRSATGLGDMNKVVAHKDSTSLCCKLRRQGCSATAPQCGSVHRGVRHRFLLDFDSASPPLGAACDLASVVASRLGWVGGEHKHK